MLVSEIHLTNEGDAERHAGPYRETITIEIVEISVLDKDGRDSHSGREGGYRWNTKHTPTPSTQQPTKYKRQETPKNSIIRQRELRNSRDEENKRPEKA